MPTKSAVLRSFVAAAAVAWAVAATAQSVTPNPASVSVPAGSTATASFDLVFGSDPLTSLGIFISGWDPTLLQLTSVSFGSVPAAIAGNGLSDIDTDGSDQSVGLVWLADPSLVLAPTTVAATFQLLPAFVSGSTDVPLALDGTTTGAFGPFVGVVTINAVPVPEPATWALLLAGGALMLARRRGTPPVA